MRSRRAIPVIKWWPFAWAVIQTHYYGLPIPGRQPEYYEWDVYVWARWIGGGTSPYYPDSDIDDMVNEFLHPEWWR